MGPPFDSIKWGFLMFYFLRWILSNYLNYFLFFGHSRLILINFISKNLCNDKIGGIGIVIRVCDDGWNEGSSFVKRNIVPPSLIAWGIPIAKFRIFLKFHELLIKQLSSDRVPNVIVSSFMSGQIWALREPFIAICESTLVWLFSCVSSNMSFQIKIQGKFFETNITFERLFPWMN